MFVCCINKMLILNLRAVEHILKIQLGARMPFILLDAILIGSGPSPGYPRVESKLVVMNGGQNGCLRVMFVRLRYKGMVGYNWGGRGLPCSSV